HKQELERAAHGEALAGPVADVAVPTKRLAIEAYPSRQRPLDRGDLTFDIGLERGAGGECEARQSNEGAAASRHGDHASSSSVLGFAARLG
ncbi:MAG: hypothetical protein JO111_17315, partial [Caulobacteraceae bacterium]|nr:hypothetical protein [Caulobacteraceae bacterium]